MPARDAPEPADRRMPLRERARVLGDRMMADIEAGDAPDDIVEGYATWLALADRHLAAGRLPGAAQAFTKGQRLAFNRVLHLNRTTSPLAAHPEWYTRPIRESAVAQRLRAPRGRDLVSAGAGSRGPDEPRRVLVVTRENANFLGEILDLLERSDEFEVRFVDLASPEYTDLMDIGDTLRAVAREVLGADEGLAARVQERLGPLFDWADTVFVEWCIPHAALLNLVDPGDTRVVLRLHSYELFTPWPHMLDLSRVDDLLFVSEHLRDFALDVVPALTEPQAPTLHALPLNKRLAHYVRPKPDEARFNLGLVGWSAVVKDPLWALDVLRLVRKQDPRYRLLLVGSPFDDSVSAATREYGSRLWRELDALEAEGAVRRVGQTGDVPAVLTEVGVILSTSVRESFHAGLVEGAASGAAPVVRDWPYFADRPTGARSLFPEEWVVSDPAEAADRVLRLTADDKQWRAAGEAASRHALSTWDWEVTKTGYLDLFRGSRCVSPSSR